MYFLRLSFNIRLYNQTSLRIRHIYIYICAHIHHSFVNNAVIKQPSSIVCNRLSTIVQLHVLIVVSLCLILFCIKCLSDLLHVLYAHIRYMYVVIDK